jgi:hypothetical protein
MPFLSRTDSIGANAFNANVWSGTQFEFAPYNALFELGVLGSATGLQMTVATGGDTLCIDQAITVVRAANQYALYPDDFVITDVIGLGQRIIEAIRNTTGGGLSHFSSIRLSPI